MIDFVLYFSLWLQQTALSLKIINKGVLKWKQNTFHWSWHLWHWNPVFGSTCTLTNNWQPMKSHHCQLCVVCFPCLLIEQKKTVHEIYCIVIIWYDIKNNNMQWLIYLKFVLNLPKLQLHSPPIPNSTNFSFSSLSISAVFKWAMSHNLGKLT